MLNRCRRQLLADRFDQAFALVPVVVVDADLDQLVTVQRAADFRQYRVGKAILADGDDGLQGMRPRAQGTTLAAVISSIDETFRKVHFTGLRP